MKKLKYMCLFYGSNLPFWLCFAGTMLFPEAIRTITGIDFRTNRIVLFGCMAAVAAGILFACACELRELSDREKNVVRLCPPPVWQPVTQRDMDIVAQYTARHSKGSTYVLLLLLMFAGMVVIAFLGDACNWNARTVLFLMVIVTGIPGGFLLRHVLLVVHWKNMNAEATYLEIRVSHCFRRTSLMMFSEPETSYLVFYMPDGKYVLECPPSNPEPIFVRIIQWKGRCIYIPHN